MDNTTRRICDYVVARRDTPLPEEALRAVRLHLTDTLACAAGGYGSPPARIAATVARSAVGQPGSRVWFDGASSTVDLAAFANGVMVRYLDYNDAGGGGHPSDTAAALIALCDAHHLPGSALATGLTIAYDVMKAAAPSMAARDHGFDQGIAVGAGVAAAAAALLGGDHAAIANALALQVVPAVPLHQTRVGALSMWKGAATSAAARSALFAAQLAVAGMTGPAEPFEGTAGLMARVTGRFDAALPASLTEPGASAIEQAYYKLRPAEFQAQAALDVVEEVAAALASRGLPAADQIEHLDIETYAFAYTEIADRDKWRPANRETADHSMPFLIASTLRFGRISADALRAGPDRRPRHPGPDGPDRNQREPRVHRALPAGDADQAGLHAEERRGDQQGHRLPARPLGQPGHRGGHRGEVPHRVRPDRLAGLGRPGVLYGSRRGIAARLRRARRHPHHRLRGLRGTWRA